MNPLQVLTAEVYEPVFLNKLASWGVPVTEQNKHSYYKLAYALKQMLIQQGVPVITDPPSVDLVKRMQAFVNDNTTVKQAVYSLLNK